MPGALLVDVEARIAELVEQHRPELAQLVDQALEAELNQLVEQRLAATNGAARERLDADGALANADSENSLSDLSFGGREIGKREPSDTDRGLALSPTTKVCTGPCGRELPLSAFEKHRAKCRECRRRDHALAREQHAAEQAPAAEPDRPASRGLEGALLPCGERFTARDAVGAPAAIATPTSTPAGLTPAQLLERGPKLAATVTPDELRRWLVTNQFAQPNGSPDTLVPTELGGQVGSAIG